MHIAVFYPEINRIQWSESHSAYLSAKDIAETTIQWLEGR